MTNQHPRLARILTAGVVLMLSAGCSVAVTTGPSASPPASTQSVRVPWSGGVSGIGVA